MTKFFHARITAPEEIDWWLDFELALKVTVVCVYHEVSQKEVSHFHAIVRTGIAREKLNKLLRKAADLTDHVSNRMAIQTKEIEGNEALVKVFTYIKKDGNLKYLLSDYQQQHDDAPKWITKSKVPEEKEEVQSEASEPKTRKSWNMYEHLEQQLILKRCRDQNWEPADRRTFVRDMLEFIDADKANWVPKFRISNFNTFYAYLAQLHWKYYGDYGDILAMAPGWL